MRDYQTKQNKGGLPDSISTQSWGAGEFNSLATENEYAVSSSGQTLAPADGTAEVTTQLAKALSIYGAGGAEYHIDTGAVNAYVLNPVGSKESPPAYFDGFTISFKPGSANTGASTVNIASLGVKNIRDINGSALTGGEIFGYVTIRYNLSSDRFEVVSSIRVNISSFTSSGSWSKPAGLTKLRVYLTGGGGGAGGVDGQGAGTIGCSGGGGGGGTVIKTYLESELSSSESFTIGAGGGGGVGAADGASGGTSTFKSLSSGGGGGGRQDTAETIPDIQQGGTVGSASGGDINLNGGGGESGTCVSAARGIAGNGGGSFFGGGARGKNVNGNGETPTSRGAGGSGARNEGSTSDRTGGSGNGGIIMFEEFF